MKPKTASPAAGVTLFELLVTISIGAIIAAIAFQVIAGVPRSSALTKLKNDVETINSAVDVYKTFGGSVDALTTPEQVLARLRSKADELSAEQIAGLTGSMIDRRLAPVMQTESEANRKQPRAIWNVDKQRFDIVASGPRGVKYFILDAKLAARAVDVEARNTGMKLATRDTWIWDYSDRVPNGAAAPTLVDGTPHGHDPVTPPATPPSPPTFPGPAPFNGPNVLEAPVFSILSGNYPITQYLLDLTLANPNPVGVSRILYSINSGMWKVYDGSPIEISPGYSVTAFAQTVDPAWSNSPNERERYRATPIRLDAPIITPTATRFDYEDNRVVTVTIADRNDPEVSMIEYRIGGTRWTAYDGPFPLFVDDNLLGATIEARAVPTQPYYLESPIVTAEIDQPTAWFSMSGRSNGVFYDPTGTSGLETNLTAGASDDFFTWGIPSGTDDPSSLFFTGAEFLDVSPGERFLAGTLDYYNGTIRSGSGAGSVDFSVSLAFNDSISLDFDFTLDLINSRNNTGTQSGDADYVLLGNVASEAPTTINGNDYNLILEFGETTPNGFSTIDQFHVFEDHSATGNLYARLEQVK